MHRILALLSGLFLATSVLAQQQLGGLAQLDPSQSGVVDRAGAVEVSLGLTQGVPWRVFTLDNPRRLVMDFREVDWRHADRAQLLNSDLVTDLRFGGFRPGWSRMVADLRVPLLVESAGMSTDADTGTAQITVRLTHGSEAQYAAASGAPFDPHWDLPPSAETAPVRRPKPPGAPTLVVLDPGHGGIDPGAERGGRTEKELMLRFAREIREALLRAGGFEVVMTRDDDRFVSLEARVAHAHRVGADIFISLHADALSGGNAKGATVYTLDERASDAASAKLAERHERGDILAGIDLTGADDVVADVLMDLARLETRPRTQRLATAMILGMGKQTGGQLNSRPHRTADFSVLKAADIPSVLIEVGFLSSDADLAKLTDPVWRALMAAGIRDGLQAWVIADRAARDLAGQ